MRPNLPRGMLYLRPTELNLVRVPRDTFGDQLAQVFDMVRICSNGAFPGRTWPLCSICRASIGGSNGPGTRPSAGTILRCIVRSWSTYCSNREQTRTRIEVQDRRVV